MPAEGTLDWHIPLNENFENLNVDVEVRDSDSNRRNYSPDSNAKFLATDTGNVYIGNGSSWNLLGNIGSNGGGASLVQPGNVQSALDAAAGTPGGGVYLDPTKTYVQPTTPWEVKENVTLYFNGAWMVGEGSRNNTDCIHIHPGGRVLNPRIDLTGDLNAYGPGNLYRGAVFKLDTQYGKYFAHGTEIRGGQVYAEGGGGTALHMEVSQNRTWITHNRFELSISKPPGVPTESSIGTALYTNTADGIDDGWINGIHVYGHWRYPVNGWIQDGDTTSASADSVLNQQNFNHLKVQYQPGDSSEKMWWIKSNTWARRNWWMGMFWDVANSDAIRIDSTYNHNNWRACTDNTAVGPNAGSVFYNGSHITNNSPREFFVNDLTTWSHDEY